MTDNGTSPRLALWALMFGNLVTGTAVLLPAGLLNLLAADFGISVATAGLLLVAGGFMVGIGAPLLAGLTTRIDRRMLLCLAMGLFAVGHLAAALAPTFELLLVIRTITMASAALFTPQAAATIGLMVPQEQRASAISFIFIGWSMASVIGIPAGSLLAEWLGYRGAFAGMAALSTLAGIACWFSLKPGLQVQPLRLSSWLAVFGSPALIVIMLVTLLSMSGQFASLSYLAPYMREGFGASPAGIATAFAVIGASGVLGNYLASRLVGRVGIDRGVFGALLMLVAGMLGVAAAFGNFWLAMVGAFLWGLGSFSSNSMQQSRLVAVMPPLAAATVALNTSAVYLGQSLGSWVGGLVIDKGVSPQTSLVSAGFLALAAVTSLVAARLSRKNQTP